MDNIHSGIDISSKPYIYIIMWLSIIESFLSISYNPGSVLGARETENE